MKQAHTQARTSEHKRAHWAIGIMAILMICALALAWLSLGLGPVPDFNRGLNELYEDGSFIISIGDASIGGCIPTHLCTR